MPSSTHIFKAETIEYILKKFSDNTKILDVGAGEGTYSRLLRDKYSNMDAVEVFENYIDTYNLRDKYNNVFVSDITTWQKESFGAYDLVIFGDVLEHITELQATKMINEITSMGIEVIVAVPFNAPQGDVGGNTYERHLQPKLTLQRTLKLYPSLTPLCVRYDYGVFVNKKTTEFYPLYYKELDSALVEKLKQAYRNRALIDVDDITSTTTNALDILDNTAVEVNEGDVTIVTGLWNMGRGELNNDFSRSYEDYKQRFVNLLKSPVKMFIYVAKEDEDLIWQHRSRENTFVKVIELSEFDKWFEFFDKVQEIRQDDSWYNQSSWLPNSPQARLKYYNAVVMSKMFMLNNATIFNPFNTTNFFWIDAGITNTVHSGYFTHDKVFNNLPKLTNHLDRFIFLSYPYDGGTEIHGFERGAIAKYAGTNYVEYVCRGGFFGGNKKSINLINAVYYSVLRDTITNNHMGTEESLFTILAHNYPDLVHRFTLSGDGLVWPFFESLKDIDKYLSSLPEKVKTYKDMKTNIYVLGFNSPNQFRMVCEAMKVGDPEMFELTRKILVNNSTDQSMFDEYDELCKLYGFEEIHKENLGVCGGRHFTAKHFDASDADFYMFFEDDMLVNDASFNDKLCKSGLPSYVENLYQRLVKIMLKDKIDFLKVSFSEFYGDNGTQWSWYNVPQHVRTKLWPDYDKLPEFGLDVNAPRTKFDEINTMDGISYIKGQIYYSNWPMIVSREGNKKMFLTTEWARPFEQTWMSYMFQETITGNIKPAILLASPINHNRISHYKPEERREN